MPSVEKRPSATSPSFEIVSSKFPTACLKSSRSKSALLFLPRKVTFLIFLKLYLCISSQKSAIFSCQELLQFSQCSPALYFFQHAQSYPHRFYVRPLLRQVPLATIQGDCA